MEEVKILFHFSMSRGLRGVWSSFSAKGCRSCLKQLVGLGWNSLEKPCGVLEFWYDSGMVLRLGCAWVYTFVSGSGPIQVTTRAPCAIYIRFGGLESHGY